MQLSVQVSADAQTNGTFPGQPRVVYAGMEETVCDSERRLSPFAYRPLALTLASNICSGWIDDCGLSPPPAY